MTEPTNGKRIEMIEDIAVLKTEIKAIRITQDEHHKELKGMFMTLTDKVNHQMHDMDAKIVYGLSTVDKKINKRSKQAVKWAIVVLLIGSFLWIKESRDFIFRIVGFVL